MHKCTHPTCIARQRAVDYSMMDLKIIRQCLQDCAGSIINAQNEREKALYSGLTEEAKVFALQTSLCSSQIAIAQGIAALAAFSLREEENKENK